MDDHQIAEIEHVVRRLSEVAPHLDIDTMQRLMRVISRAFSPEPVPPEILARAVVRVLSQRSEDAPEPVGDNQPPE